VLEAILGIVELARGVPMRRSQRAQAV